MVSFQHFPRIPVWLGAGLLAVSLALPAVGQVIGYEVSVAQIEAGRLRHLAERLAKQNVLYQLRLGTVRKSDLVTTSARLDRVLETLELGSPGYAVPAPWTQAIRDQLNKVQATWQPLRKIALASQTDMMQVAQEYMSAEGRRRDPLVIRYFDNLAADLVKESENLMAIYDAECKKSGATPELCVTASISGYSAMLSERATKEAVYIVAGMDVPAHKKLLDETMEAYLRTRKAIAESPFFAKALSPERGEAGAFARNLLGSVASDWDSLQRDFEILEAGDEKNFDLGSLLERHEDMVERIERFTAAMVRYANVAYGT